MKKTVDWQKTAAVLFCAAFATGLFFLIGKYLIVALLPFLVALGIAAALRPPAAMLSSRLGISKKLCSAFLLILLFLVLGFAFTYASRRLFAELTRLLRRLSENGDSISAAISAFAERIRALLAKLPFLHGLADREYFGLSLPEMLSDIAKNLTLTLTTKLPGAVASLASGLPSLLLTLIITVIATFYFTLDLDTVSAFCLSILPIDLRDRWKSWRLSLKGFLGRYLRAYALILFLTFCELYVGFTVLSLDYSFLTALLISFVDIFPILGVGTVLAPWAAAVMIAGNYSLGIGLLILWAAVTVIRQIIEPRILGGTLGLHPIPMLMGMYIGYRFFGVIGILLSPAVIMMLRIFLRELGEQKKMEQKP